MWETLGKLWVKQAILKLIATALLTLAVSIFVSTELMQVVLSGSDSYLEVNKHEHHYRAY